MNRRDALPVRRIRFERIGAAVVSTLALAFGPLGCEPEPQPPHVVMIVLDTVRADGVTAKFGDRKVAPVFERLAAEGTRFDNAYSVAPWTLPSHATLFTGLAPSQHKAVHENFLLGPQYLTLAEFLKTRDYATFAVSSNPWVTKSRGLAQGFDRFELAFTSPEEMTDKGAERATDLAIGFLDSIDQAEGPPRPFFLFVNYLEAHLPYAPPDAGFEALGIDPASLSRRVFSIAEAEAIMAGKREALAEEFELARTLYHAEIAYQDQQLGRLIAALESRGLLDETLLVVTADHGEEFGREGMMGHEFTLSDEVLSVPLVFRYPPRVPSGGRVALPVSHLDVVPTVLHAIGEWESADDLEGRSLLDTPSLSLDRPLLAEYSEPVTLREQYWKNRHPDFDTEKWAVSLRSLRKGERKLVENSRGEVTLIDADRPRDAAPDDDRGREIVARSMREELASWLDRLATGGRPGS